MKRTVRCALLCLNVFILSCSLLGQETPDEKPVLTQEMKKAFRTNQHKLDQNFGGIGIMFYRPALGPLVSYERPWMGVSILSDIFEFKFGVGENRILGLIPSGFSFTETVDTRQFGYQVGAGVNCPIKFLAFGAQRSPLLTFRGHPVVAADLGVFGMRDVSKYYNEPTAKIWYLGINPGYRLRVPMGSIELNLNTRIGITSGSADTYYKGFGFYPSLTFRLDAMKWKYNPQMVRVDASVSTISNYNSSTKHTGTRYNSDGSRVDYYTTHTSYDVTVSKVNMGVQDIGPHFGIGPKFSLMNPRRTPYVPASFLIGLVGEGRGGPIDFGITLEAGRVGHGSELEPKSDTGKYRKKLDKLETFGRGTLQTVNLHINLGIDISPLFLAPLGIAMNKGEATSYLSATAGLIMGGHLSWDQRYIDPSVQAIYDEIVQDHEGVVKRKFLDPSQVGPGYLGGFYFSVQVGAMSFKVTNYRYYGAPFASNTLLGVAYRFPVFSNE